MKDKQKYRYDWYKDDGSEVFVDVVENPNYQVSNHGQLLNKKTGKIVQGSFTNKGYIRARLNWDNGNSRTYAIHRLIAHAFYALDKVDDLDVNHINGDKSNNNLSNLEWCTRSENMKHAYSTGLAVMSNEAKIHHRDARRNYCQPVRCIETGDVYIDAKVASRYLGVNYNDIRKVTRGEREQAKGYHFELADWSEINVTE